MQILSCEIPVDETGRELKRHGTALFPIAAYHDDLGQADVAWHWHDELEAAVVTAGTVVIAADRERVVLHAGDGCFINANVLHGAWNAERGTPCRLHSLVFHPRLIGGSAESVFWQKYILPVTENPSFQILALRAGEAALPLSCIENAWRLCVEEPVGFEFLARHELSKLLLSVGSLLPREAERLPVKKRREEERMKSMLRYIREHLAEPLTVRDIAAAAAVSESECIRCFRGTIGTTPIRYAIQLRLQRAAELLEKTDGKISEIGEACGFQEMGYFARSFREHYGSTPSDYRRQKRSGEGAKGSVASSRIL